MSTATYEQRLQALEAAVADLRSQQSAHQADRRGVSADDLPPDTEQPFVPGVPPKDVMWLRARLAIVQPGSRGLGLSQSEWAALNLEDADE